MLRGQNPITYTNEMLLLIQSLVCTLVSIFPLNCSLLISANDLSGRMESYRVPFRKVMKEFRRPYQESGEVDTLA